QADTQPCSIDVAKPALQQAALRIRLVTEHPALPAIIEAVPGKSQPINPADSAKTQQRQRLVIEQSALTSERFLKPALDPLGGHLEGRVDADPAALGRPILDPGVRVELAHGEVVARRIEFAALIARHD